MLKIGDRVYHIYNHGLPTLRIKSIYKDNALCVLEGCFKKKKGVFVAETKELGLENLLLLDGEL